MGILRVIVNGALNAFGLTLGIWGVSWVVKRTTGKRLMPTGTRDIAGLGLAIVIFFVIVRVTGYLVKGEKKKEDEPY